MPMTPSTTRKTLFLLAGVTFVAAGVLLWNWISRPQHPDIATTSLDELVAFLGTDGFARLRPADRSRYCDALAERLGKERSFLQLVGMLLARRDQMKPVVEHIKRSGVWDEAEAAMLRVMLEKFYGEPPATRAMYLRTLIMMQQTGMTQDGIGLPSADQLRHDMTRVVTHQPPRTVAQIAQFAQDLQKERQAMGVPNPY